MTAGEQAAAENLNVFTSNYQEDVNQMYIGQNDISVEFLGGSNFAGANPSGLNFGIKLTNSGKSAKDRVVAIIPGYFDNAADIIADLTGLAVDAIVADGTMVGGEGDGDCLVGSGTPKKIADFIKFIKHNPTRISFIKMLVDDEAQIEEPIYIKKLSPFRNLEDVTLYPSVYKDSNQQNAKRVEIETPDLQFDNQTIVIYRIGAGRTVSMNFFPTAVANTAATLAKKATVAASNIQLLPRLKR